MKKFKMTIAAMTAILSIVSCQKENNISVTLPDDAPLSVRLCVGGETKVTGVNPLNEKKYNSVQFFVFDATGRLEDYKSVTGNSATLGVLAGAKTFVAVLNVGENLSDAATLESLNAKVTKLKDNAVDHFVMVGAKEQPVSSSGASVTIPVKRLVAKITINKITTAFESSAMMATNFKVERIYLINAAGDAHIGSSGTPTIWYNESGWHGGSASPADAADALISDSVSLDLTGNKSNAVSHSFYCYPNSFDTHNTVLELAVKIGGETDYYCIDFSTKGVGAIEPNKTYTVDELVIKHRGNDHDGDGNVEGSASVDCTISIDEWDETGLSPYTETL